MRTRHVKHKLTDRDLVAIGANQAVEGLSQEIDELLAKVERLQQERDRSLVLLFALTQCGPDAHNRCMIWLGVPVERGGLSNAIREYSERGRALVEETKSVGGCSLRKEGEGK